MKIEGLTDKDITNYHKIVDEAKEKNRNSPFMIANKKKFINSRTKKYKGNKNKAVYDYNRMNEKQLLLDSTVILDDCSVIKVEDILNNPEIYNERCAHDVFEPEYNNGQPDIAKIYSLQKPMIIHSFAHGGIKYKLPSITPVHDYESWEYWKENFYLVTCNEKNKVYEISNNRISARSMEGFKSRFKAYKFRNNEGNFVPATQYWLESKEIKAIDVEDFNPGKDMIYKNDLNQLTLNEYFPDILQMGIQEPTAQEIKEAGKIFSEHVHKVFDNTVYEQYVFDYLSFLIQRPEERPDFALVVTSLVHGVGKDTIGVLFSRMMDKYYKNVSIEKILSPQAKEDFLYKSKLVHCEEVGRYKTRYEVTEGLKSIISKQKGFLDIKYEKQCNTKIYCGFYFTSNEEFPFSFSSTDRRFLCLASYMTQDEKNKLESEGHYTDLYNYFSDENKIHLLALYRWLEQRTIEMNCKGDAPLTIEKKNMIEHHISEADQWFIDLAEGKCHYWTEELLNKKFIEDFSVEKFNNERENLRRFWKSNMKPVEGQFRFGGKRHRVRTFTHELKTKSIEFINKSINDTWNNLFDESESVREYALF